MEAPSTSRLDSLESILAHLERQYDELNKVVIEQGKDLSRLRHQMLRVSSSVEGMELDRIKAHNPKPPHSVI